MDGAADFRARAEQARQRASSTDQGHWPEPDMGVLRLHRRLPPPLPLAAFGSHWAAWIESAADAAACPADYVAAPLLASASAPIGHARWAQATPSWTEPPHLWIGAVGDSGNGKSPGADCLMRDVLPEIYCPRSSGAWLSTSQIDCANGAPALSSPRPRTRNGAARCVTRKSAGLLHLCHQ